MKCIILALPLEILLISTHEPYSLPCSISSHDLEGVWYNEALLFADCFDEELMSNVLLYGSCAVRLFDRLLRHKQELSYWAIQSFQTSITW